MGVYLSKPNNQKSSGSGFNNCLKYGYSSMQGWRSTMEDAHITSLSIDTNVSLFAVFDGHGTNKTSKFCERYFQAELEKNENFQSKNYKKALEETFAKMDEILAFGLDVNSDKAVWRNNFSFYSGSTATVVLITEDEIYVANAGDSRAILYTKDKEVISLTNDHKPEDDFEKQRIVNAGGIVFDGRINGGLNLSRAIGDFQFKQNKSLAPNEQMIISVPDIVVHKIDDNVDFIVLGCDGIWETMKAQHMCSLIDKRIRGNKCVKIATICEELLDKLVAKDLRNGHGCDNMTCVIIHFVYNREDQLKN